MIPTSLKMYRFLPKDACNVQVMFGVDIQSQIKVRVQKFKKNGRQIAILNLTSLKIVF